MFVMRRECSCRNITSSATVTFSGSFSTPRRRPSRREWRAELCGTGASDRTRTRM